jgi:hypothetical protein
VVAFRSKPQGILDPSEETLITLTILLIIWFKGTRQLLKEAALLLVELIRYNDPHHYNLVAAPLLAQVGHTLPADAEGLPSLCSGWYAQLFTTVNRRHLQLVAKCRLGHIQPQLQEDIVTLTHEAGVGLHIKSNVEVTKGSPPWSDITFATDA